MNKRYTVNLPENSSKEKIHQRNFVRALFSYINEKRNFHNSRFSYPLKILCELQCMNKHPDNFEHVIQILPIYEKL